MFYIDKEFTAFRFGDVLKDFLTILPKIHNPVSNLEELNFAIHLSANYHVILSPCCSIKDEVLLLAPLQKITSVLLKYPYFVEDNTIFNKMVPKYMSYTNEHWSRLEDDIKTSSEMNEEDYAYYNYFFYAESALLNSYKVNKTKEISTKCYMIDFRRSFCVECKGIRKVSGVQKVPIETKLLELTPATRQELRYKIGYFYSRTPDEDEPFLATP